MQLFIHLGFGIHCSAYLSAQRFPITRPQASDMAPKRRRSHFQPICQLSISWRRVRATGHEDPQFVEEQLLASSFVICRKPFQSSSDQRLRPSEIEEPISVAGATVSLEKRLRLFRLLFMQRQEILSTATLERPFSISSVRQKILKGGEQKCTEFTLLPIRAGVNFTFKQVSEKTLREVLCIMHTVSATAHKTVKRRPIGLAKLGKRSPRNVRFGLASPGREHYAPVGRRKKITLVVPVPHAGIHVNGRYQNRRRKASYDKNLNFVQHALQDPFLKESNHHAL